MSSLGDRSAWVSMATARRMLGLTRQRIYQLITEGKLIGIQTDGQWLINRRSCLDRAAGRGETDAR
jgi:hypothetical protein